MKDILIVQDSVDAFSDMSGELGFYSRYFTCIMARNGKTALEMLKTAVIDVVITGTTIPDMDGLAFVKQVNKSHPEVTVFVVAKGGEGGAASGPELADTGRPLYHRHAQDLSGLAASIMAS